MQPTRELQLAPRTRWRADPGEISLPNLAGLAESPAVNIDLADKERRINAAMKGNSMAGEAREDYFGIHFSKS